MPPVTQALLIANVAVFFLANMAGGGWLFNWFALWPPTSGPSLGPGYCWWAKTHALGFRAAKSSLYALMEPPSSIRSLTKKNCSEGWMRPLGVPKNSPH